MHTVRGDIGNHSHSDFFPGIILIHDEAEMFTTSARRAVVLGIGAFLFLSSAMTAMELLLTRQGHTDDIHSLCPLGEGVTVASGSLDGTIKFWNTTSAECVKTLQGHSIHSLCLLGDGETLAMDSADDPTELNNQIKIWNTTSGECVKTLQGHALVVWLCLLDDGVTLASGSADSTIKFWNTISGECVKTLQTHTSTVLSLCLLGDGETLASGSGDNTIKLWNTASGECMKTLQGHTEAVRSLCLLGDGETLASGSCDNTIKFWHPDGGFIRQCWRLCAISRALRDVIAIERPSTARAYEVVITLAGHKGVVNRS